MSGTNRCAKCDKIVGFAEAVHRDEKVFHPDCYRCNSCNKKLQRGLGLTHNGENYCHKCHQALFGPMGFRPGVVRNRATIRRVKMAMQPPFAHVSVNLKKNGVAAAIHRTLSGSKASKDSREDKKRLHQFDVAVFTGKTPAELEAFLKEGNVDVSKWAKTAVGDLLDQLQQGQAELGLDTDGNALRVASVVKTLVYDKDSDLVLFSPLNSLEGSSAGGMKSAASAADEDARLDAAFGCLNDNMYAGVRDILNFHLDHVPQPLHDFVYTGVYEALGFNNIASSGLESQKVAGGKVEIPGALVLETTFATLKETPAEAGARLFTGRFKMKNATSRIFERMVHKKVVTHKSTRFEGLNSEYQIHYIMLKKALVKPLQKSLPPGKVTPVRLANLTNSGMDTNWYVWLHKGTEQASALVSELEKVYKSDPKVKGLVGDVDFKGPLAMAMGKVMLDEIQAIDMLQ